MCRLPATDCLAVFFIMKFQG